jgi:hypothetical protein
MAISSAFFGFEDPNTNAAILLASLPVQAFAELERSVSPETLKREGVTLEKREAMQLATGKAFLVVGRQEIEKTKIHKWILLAHPLSSPRSLRCKFRRPRRMSIRMLSFARRSQHLPSATPFRSKNS